MIRHELKNNSLHRKSVVECPACGASATAACHFLGHGAEINSYVPTRYAPTKSQQMPCCYQLVQCCSCNNVFFHHSKKIDCLGFTHPSVRQNEPDVHLDSVVKAIISHLEGTSPNKYVSPLLTSWKDQRLSHRIKSYFSCTPSYNSSSANLLLTTRYLEHLSSIEDIYKHQSELQLGDYIYIEALDFFKLSSSGNQSFFWSERIWYPTLNQVLSIYQALGFKCVRYENVSECSEPFWWVLLQKQKNSTINKIQFRSNPDLDVFYRNYFDLLDHIKLMTHNVSCISFYGMNHKMFTLVDLILSEDTMNHRDLYLYDSSLEKVSTFWNDLKVNDFNDLDSMRFHDGLHIFAFNPNIKKSLLDDIISLNSSAKILHVNDFFATGNC